MKEKKEKNTAAPAENKAAGGAKNRKLIIILSVVLAVLVLLAVGATFAGRAITMSKTNLPNVYVGGIYVGGMTKEETRAELEKQLWDKSVSGILTVNLPLDVSFRVDYTRAGANLTTEKAVEAAYRYGHDGNWFENLLTYIKGVVAPEDISGEELTLNKDYITKLMNAGIEKFDLRIADTAYTIDEENSRLVLIKGAGQLKIDADALYEQTAQALLNKETEITCALPDSGLTMPDFEAIHEELAAIPSDAYYDKETDSVVPDVKGVDFDVSQAKSLWNQAKATEKVEIPVTLTIPEVTEESLKELLFRDKLGACTTYYYGSTASRINNIDLVAQKLNGLVLMPGEEFSYNGYVGQRTEEAGFQYAGAYNNGQVVQEIGGGICQVSSTLYYATMCANLQTLERTCHTFIVTYLPMGLDATVSWPGPDFKFKNDRDYPIKILAWTDQENKALTIEIWGSNIDGTYVEPKSSWWAVYDKTYPDVQIGWGAFSMRYLYDKDGNLIEKIDEFNSLYDLHDYEIKWPEGVTPPGEGETGGETGGGDSGGSGSGSGESGGGDTGSGDEVIIVG